MNLVAGTILKSTSAMDDPNFRNVTVLLVRRDEDGILGLIVNKPSHRQLHHLEEFEDVPDTPLYNGGPVDQEHLYFLHRRPDLIQGGEQVTGEVFFGGDFTKATSYIRMGILSTDDIKIFIGYCGWDAGELEREIEEGYWSLMAPSAAGVFN